MEKELVENCDVLSIWEVMRERKATAREMIEEEYLPLVFKDYEGNKHEQTLFFCSSKTNFNGIRAWFICGDCGRRVGCLYLRPYGVRYLCRKCNNLSYFSQKLRGNVIWEHFGKYFQKRAQVMKKYNQKRLRKKTRVSLLTELKRLETLVKRGQNMLLPNNSDKV